MRVMMFRRDFRVGALVRLHLTDGTTAEGEYVGRSRNYYHCRAGKLEAGGALVSVTGDRLLVRRVLVKSVQVITP